MENNTKRFFALSLLTICVYVFLIDSSFALNIGGAAFLVFAPTPILNSGSPFEVGQTPAGAAFCSIIAMMNSGITRALAALCVIFIGIAGFFGQVKWGQAVMLGVGIAVMFGAASLVKTVPVIKSPDAILGSNPDITPKGVVPDIERRDSGVIKTCTSAI